MHTIRNVPDSYQQQQTQHQGGGLANNKLLWGAGGLAAGAATVGLLNNVFDHHQSVTGMRHSTFSHTEETRLTHPTSHFAADRACPAAAASAAGASAHLAAASVEASTGPADSAGRAGSMALEGLTGREGEGLVRLFEEVSCWLRAFLLTGFTA